MEWLEWPGWGGISGIVAVIALIVAVGAVIEFALTIGFETRRDIDITVRRGEADRQYTLTMTPRAATILYEVEFMAWGFNPVEGYPRDVRVLGVRDEPLVVTFTVPPDRDVAACWVGAQWLHVSMLGMTASSQRVEVEGPGTLEYLWYRWRWWPRKFVGRWRPVRNRLIRGSLVDPAPVRRR